MSLYANISVPRAQGNSNPSKPGSKPPSKSASLYAAILGGGAPAPKEDKPTTAQVTVIEEPPRPAEVVPVSKPEPTSALQFKPSIRRPQKPLKSKGAGTTVTAVPVHQGGSNKSFLQDVSRLQEDIANDDVNGFYRTLEGQRLARKAARKKKRKNNDGKGTYIWSWDDDYDPTHPNDYDTYKDSDEQLREQIEWKRYLEGKDELEDEGEEEEDTGYRGFAPPKDYEEREEPEWEEPQDEGEEFVPEPAAEVNVDESADEVFARRMRMAQEAGLKIRPPTPPPVVDLTKENPPAPPPPPPVQPANISPPAQPQVTYDISFTQPPSLYASAPGMPFAPPLPSTHTPSISSEPVHYSSEPVHYESSTNSSEPVRYEETQDEPRGSHPGQKNFASRLMSKYGWEKGQSLGATPTQGLVTPLLMKVDKDRKGAGVIINKNKQVEDHGPFGKMSRCIMMWNVVGRGEVDEDLVEDIGQECREKYGEVERIRVVENPKAKNEAEVVKVFVLFTSELSALRAVNALEGRLFGGRTLKAKFYDAERFDSGDFRS